MGQYFLVSLDDSDLRKVAIRLGPYAKKAPLAISRSLNRAALTARDRAVREVSGNYYVRASDVRNETIIDKATRTKLSAMVDSVGYKIPLDKFKYGPKNPRPKKPPKSLKVTVKKANGPKDFFHAFVVDANGNKIFERTGEKAVMSRGRYAGKRREKIWRMVGPSIPQMMGTQRSREEIFKASVAMYEKRLDHEIKRIQESKEQ